MHELSIMQSIFEIVMDNAKKNQLSKINQINVVVGEISGVEPDALEFAFQYFARNTMAEDAKFIITTVPLTGKCRQCGVELAGISNLKCNCSGPPDYELITGRELYVNTITGG